MTLKYFLIYFSTKDFAISINEVAMLANCHVNRSYVAYG